VLGYIWQILFLCRGIFVLLELWWKASVKFEVGFWSVIWSFSLCYAAVIFNMGCLSFIRIYQNSDYFDLGLYGSKGLFYLLCFVTRGWHLIRAVLAEILFVFRRYMKARTTLFFCYLVSCPFAGPLDSAGGVCVFVFGFLD
jgi:hypothetical protein